MSLDEVPLNRAQRRRLQKLGERIDRITRADAMFFERFPRRNHRTRLAAPVEIEEHEIATGKPLQLPRGFRLYAAVRQIEPGVRVRVFRPAPADRDCDVSEEFAAGLFADCIKGPL